MLKRKAGQAVVLANKRQYSLHKVNLFDVFVVFVCMIFAIVCFYPIWYVFVVSIMPYEKFLGKTLIVIPSKPTLMYYKAIFISGPMARQFTRAMFVSFLKTSFGSVSGLMITAMLAYGVSKKRIKGMKLVNFMIILTMFFGGGLIPTFLLVRSLGLLNTFWAMVIPSLVQVGYFIIMRNYFSYSVPPELEDAALIDGANELKIFFRIVLPISKPMLAAIFLFLAVLHWNDYYSYLIYTSANIRLQPFVWLLRRILIRVDLIGMTAAGREFASQQREFIPPFPLKMATVMCAMIPIILVYPFLQKHFAKGILIGAVKE